MTVETPLFFARIGEWHVGAPASFALSALSSTVAAQKELDLREAKSPALAVTASPPALDVTGFIFIADVAEYAFLNAGKSASARQAAVDLVVSAFSDKALMADFFTRLEKLVEGEDSRGPEIFEIVESALAALYKPGQERFKSLISGPDAAAGFTATASRKKPAMPFLLKMAERLVETASPKFLKSLFARYDRDGLWEPDDIKTAAFFASAIKPALPPGIRGVMVGRPHANYVLFAPAGWIDENTRPVDPDNLAAVDLNGVEVKHSSMNPGGTLTNAVSYKTERAVGTPEMKKMSRHFLRRSGGGP